MESKKLLIGIVAFLSLLVLIIGSLYINSLISGAKTRVIVKSITPKGEKVSPWADFTFTFSEPLVDNSLINTELPDRAVQFTPTVKGTARWIARDTVRFYLESPLAPSASYTVELASKLRQSSLGFAITGDRKFTFATEPFHIQSRRLEFKYTKTHAKAVGSITFNYPVNIADLRANLSIRLQENIEIPYTLQPQNGVAREIKLETEEIPRLLGNQNLKVRIEKGFKCTGGQIGLKEASIRSMTLTGRGTLGVTYANVRESSGRPHIKLRFSSPIPVDTVQPYIHIKPELNTQIITRYGELEIHGDFKRRSKYEVTVQEGLKAPDGSVLRKPYSVRLTIPDVRPQVRFVGKGFFLTRNQNMNLGLATTNVHNVKVQIEKVFGNNLVYASKVRNWGSWTENLGKPIHSGTLAITSKLNEEVTTPIDLGQYLNDKHVGIFKVNVQGNNDYWLRATQWVMLTDIGTVAKRSGDELWVWVNSLSDLKPISQATVKLISDNNQTLLSGKTNWQGFIKFSAVAQKTDGFTPFMLTVEKGNDLSFIQFNRHQLSTGDFNVGGSAYLATGYEAFLYTSRGVYRPGEKVSLAAIVRGKRNTTPPSLPTNIQILAPDGRVINDFKQNTDRRGGCEVTIPLPAYAQTGSYIAKMNVAGKEIGRVPFQVEEFMPDRMKVTVAAEKSEYDLGAEVVMDVSAVNLFGPPAANRKVKAAYALEAVPYVPTDKWRSFHFASAIPFEKQRITLEETKTDAEGKVQYKILLPETVKAPSQLNAVLTATVSEPGGRAVTAAHRVVVHPYSHYIGIKRSSSGRIKRNQDVSFNYIALDKNGNAIAGRDLGLTVYKVHWNTILRRNARGRYEYVSDDQLTTLESHQLISTAEIGTFTFTPSEYGQYRIHIEDIASGAKTELKVETTGWGNVPLSMENPNLLEMTLDKPAYQPGETAKLQIKAPFPGKLILTMEREKILSYRTVNLRGNTASLNIPIQYNYKPNIYLSGTLIRSTDSLEEHAPARAFGIIPLKLDAKPNRLNIEFDVPEEIRPNSDVNVKFRVRGRQSAFSHVTIAAVDEGILQLTDFQAPDPHRYFYRQRGLKTRAYDLYSAILPEIDAVLGDSSPGGDAASLANGRGKRLNTASVMRVKPVSLWSGILRTDRYGRGTASFHIPQFNGTLRLMAVAFSNEYYGSAEKFTVVREPVVLTPTFPRFLSGGDHIQFPISVHNGTGKDGKFDVEIQATGDVQFFSSGPVAEGEVQEHLVKKQVQIAAGGEEQLIFELLAHDSIGKATFKLSAAGNDESTQLTVQLPLRSAAPPVTETGHGTVSVGNAADFVLPSNFIAESSEFALTVSPFPAIEFAGGIRYLLKYPYGCLEQTTSKVFPLLYYSDVARVVDPELASDDRIDHYITAGINKLEGMLTPQQHFSYWPGGSYINHWSSVYASHFLVEARKAGYEVSDRVYNGLLNGLRNQAKQISSTQKSVNDSNKYKVERAVYACYVLAAAGEPEKGVMHYFKNNLLSSLTNYSQFQLAGAFALSGDLETALSMLPISIPSQNGGNRQSGHNFNSPTRSQAIILDVLAEVNENHPSIPMLVSNLSNAASKRKRWGTTQENAFAFLALGKILKKQMDGNYTGRITLNGTHLADFDSTTPSIRLANKDWDGVQVKISIQGKGNCYYYWSAFGIRRDSYIEEYDRDLEVRRRYLNQDGVPYDGEFRHGDLVIAEVTVKALNWNLENVVVVDMLPAGFEIENARLASRAGIPWLKAQDFKPDYVDIRDDRLIFFGAFPRQRERKFHYALRAVTRGEFTLPPVSAEAMYDPANSSVAGSGKIKVVE